MTQHGSSRPSGPDLPQPTHAERARTLVHRGGPSSLATMSRRRAGYPFASVMPYGSTDRGDPLLLISTMAMHTQNLQQDPRATLLVTTPGEDLLGSARVSLIGDAGLVGESDRAGARERYLASQPAAAQWIDYDDFQLWRLSVIDVYYVGGFGVMGWVEAADYAAARPDPLSDDSEAILSHMNQDHADALVELSRHFGHDAQGATMTAVDRLGFHVRLQTPAGPRGARLPFPAEVRTPDQCRQALIQMLTAARQE